MNPAVDEVVSDVNRVIGRYRTALYACETASNAFKAFGDALQEFNRTFPVVTKLAVTVRHVTHFVDLLNPFFTGYKVWKGSRKPRMWALLIVHLELFADVTSRLGISPFGEVPALIFNISVVALSVLNILDHRSKFGRINASVEKAVQFSKGIRLNRDINERDCFRIQDNKNRIEYAPYRKIKVGFAMGEDASKLCIAIINIAASAFALPQKNLVLASVALLAAGAMMVSLTFKNYYNTQIEGAKLVKYAARSIKTASL